LIRHLNPVEVQVEAFLPSIPDEIAIAARRSIVRIDYPDDPRPVVAEKHSRQRPGGTGSQIQYGDAI
jgi:hypothetical protein